MENKNIIISVIVPTKNSARTLDTCLRSVIEQTIDGVELIVVDNNSSDATLQIAEKYTTRILQKGPERSAQRNFGVENSSGEYILIIDSDMELTPDVLGECVTMLSGNKSLHALVISEESVGSGFWARCKRLERSFYIGVDWMEAARCFRRFTFDEFGGYDEDNTGTEDYDLPQRIQGKYGAASTGRISSMILHHEGEISLLYSCKKKFYYARRLDIYRKKQENTHNFKKQSNPLFRYLLFFSDPKKLFKNPLLGAGMLFMKGCEFSFGLLGYMFRKRASTVAADIYADNKDG